MRLTVLTTPELALGYRLAGAGTRACSSAAEAETVLRELLERRVEGVIAVHRAFLDDLDEGLRDVFEQRDSTLIVALPSGESPERAEERRSRLLRLLRHAVGYEMTFESEEP
jgi:vacuolar-type H+-ATPase subunit F/Vma7